MKSLSSLGLGDFAGVFCAGLLRSARACAADCSKCGASSLNAVQLAWVEIVGLEGGLLRTKTSWLYTCMQQ